MNERRTLERIQAEDKTRTSIAKVSSVSFAERCTEIIRSQTPLYVAERLKSVLSILLAGYSQDETMDAITKQKEGIYELAAAWPRRREAAENANNNRRNASTY